MVQAVDEGADKAQAVVAAEACETRVSRTPSWQRTVWVGTESRKAWYLIVLRNIPYERRSISVRIDIAASFEPADHLHVIFRFY